YQKDKDTATPSYKGNFRKVGLDYLDGIYGDKNIFSTPRDLLQLDLARRSPNFVHQNLQEAIYRGYSYENRGAKNYGLGIRMIEWTTGETPFYFHNGWWHGSTSSFITLGKENVTIISLSNKFNHETYKVKYIATYFGDYPFKIKDSLE
ncbi:serine hydrolase, partial [Flavobacterium branchiophilum]